MNSVPKSPPVKILLVFIAVLVLSIASIRKSAIMLGNNDEQHMDGTGENKENTEDGHAHEYVPTRRFSDNTRLNVDRGLNIINCWSGHQMAAWTYEGRKPIDKKYLTWKGEPKEKILYDPSDATKLADDDTLFVSYAKIEEFTMDFLPYINTTFVLITTPFHILYPAGIDLLAPNITSNKHLLQWFATNIGNYTGGHQFHPLVSPFPLGLKPHMGSRPFQHPIPYYREIFLKTMNDTEEMTMKKNIVFAGYISRTHEGRSNIPSGPKLGYEQYLEQIARSRYVISPNGDHPDCHRHYEALGLGAIPITQLDPYLYSHLKEGPIIYDNDNWNLTELTSTLTLPAPKVNRNMIFEEYWMEYVERVVGRPLWWWDVVDAKRSKLAEFAASNQYKLQSNDTL
uniref:Exostosin GT47 domain-containing protein n=2 Tax=Ditylum brightwellii TaxID=49249 RepID=A0A6V2FXP0_9STRA|mmetsp:Transcript_21139/g.27824  ORF Transcript_21139/g.27824 Transcript_21139/m.27824 type:complete len:398 (-) Transcript_21139:368-1561(-)